MCGSRRTPRAACKEHSVLSRRLFSACAIAAFLAACCAGQTSGHVREWQDRKFGMFIHFGLYSIPGGVWKGQRITRGYSEQIMSHAPVPREE
jgi:hypothetical protein